MNKIIKKNQTAKSETFAQYSVFKSNIQRYYQRREQSFVDEQNETIEKFQDRLYKIAVKKNEKIDNLNNLKEKKVQHYQKLKDDLKYKLEDHQISQEHYDSQLKTLEETYQQGKAIDDWHKNKLAVIEDKFQQKKEKFTEINKIKNEKLKVDLENFKKKMQRLQKQDLDKLESKKEEIEKTNNAYSQKLKIQLDNFLKDKNLKEKELQNQFDQKQIGKHTFNSKLDALKEKHEKLLEKHNQKKYNYKPLVLNAETIKQRSLRIVNENNDKHFLPKLLTEMKNVVLNNKIIFTILLLLFYTSVYNSNFWSLQSLFITMKQYSEVVILAFAMTLVIITGGIDLSVGSVMAFAGVVMCYLASTGTNIYLAILMGILSSTLIGLFNGILIGYARIVPFIVTLSGLLAFRGLSMILADSKPIQLTGNAKEVMDTIGNTDILGLNSQIWILIIFALIFIFVLKFTVFGRQVFAIGSNRTAARLSGVLDKRVEMLVYTISGFMAGVAGLLIASRIQSIQPTAGIAWELKAIASVVVGGTLLTGGKGGIVGTLVGWIVLSFMPTVFITLGYSFQIERVATGVIIVVAIFFNNNLDFKSGFKGVQDRVQTIWNQYFTRKGL